MSTYVPPPPAPAPRGGGNSAVKWIALGCGGCLVLVVLVLGVLVYFGNRMMGGAIRDSMQVAMDMQNLRRQIMQYKTDNGKYPDTLQELVPRYVRSEAGLRLSTRPAGPPYTYHKPGPSAQPDDVLLEYTLSVEMEDGQRVEVPVRMLINGHTRQGGSRVIPSPGRENAPTKQPAGAGAQ